MKNEIKKAPVMAMRQAGLTLIELTIVLLILIALSGLLLPFVQGFVDKTHDSANSDSLKEVSKQIQSYSNLYSGYPEDLESLIVGTAAVQPNATPTPGLAPGGVGSVMPAMMRANLFTPATLTGAMDGGVVQMQNAGISRVMTMWGDAGVGNHTLKATDAQAILANPAGAGQTSLVAAIDPQYLNNEMSMTGGANCSVPPVAVNTALAITAAPAMGAPNAAFSADDIAANACLAELLNRPADDIDVVHNDYVVLGIGNDSSLIGRTMAEAPIHFAKVGGMNAANRYNHILAVFEVKKGGMGMHPAAVFMGTLMPMMRLEGQAQAQGSYYAGDGA